jgi:hypothetical protein
MTGTQPGWCLNFAVDTYELHDERGQVTAWVTAELVGQAPEVTKILEARLGVPFPEAEL